MRCCTGGNLGKVRGLNRVQHDGAGRAFDVLVGAFVGLINPCQAAGVAEKIERSGFTQCDFERIQNFRQLAWLVADNAPPLGIEQFAGMGGSRCGLGTFADRFAG